MKCCHVYGYGRGTGKMSKQVAAALEEVSIGREVNEKYEVTDLISKIFDLQDRIEQLESVRYQDFVSESKE